jgi:hypothetical protein
VILRLQSGQALQCSEEEDNERVSHFAARLLLAWPDCRPGGLVVCQRSDTEGASNFYCLKMVELLSGENQCNGNGI